MAVIKVNLVNDLFMLVVNISHVTKQCSKFENYYMYIILGVIHKKVYSTYNYNP